MKLYLWPEDNKRVGALYLDILLCDPIRILFGKPRGGVFTWFVFAVAELVSMAAIWAMASLAAWTYPHYSGLFVGKWEIATVVVLGHVIFSMEVCRADWNDRKRLFACYERARKWKK